MGPPPRLRSLVPLGVLAAMLAGCGDSPADPGPSVAGLYLLATVNAQELPWVLHHTPDERVELVHGSFELGPDQTCRFILEFLVTRDDEPEIEQDREECVWEQDGLTVTFSYEDGLTDEGIVQNGRLTIISQGVTFVFERE